MSFKISYKKLDQGRDQTTREATRKWIIQMYQFLRFFKESLEDFLEPSFTKISLDNSTIALVTGGSRGFGWELALQLAQRDVKVVIADVGPPSSVFPANGAIAYYKCDVTDYKQIKDLRVWIKKRYGNVNMLFNNAGIVCISSLEETPDSDIQKVIDVNYTGAYMMIQTFLPDMIDGRNGYIVNVASVLGIVSPSRVASYGASKGGLIAYHNSLSQRLRRSKSKGVKTLLLCPGKLRTDMFSKVKTPSKLLAPDVDPKKLASQTLIAISNNDRRTLNIPFYVNLVPFIKKLNWPYLRILKRISGMDKSTAIPADR